MSPGAATRLRGRDLMRAAVVRRLGAPALLRALMRRLAPLLLAGVIGAALAHPAAASDWAWFHDDAASHLSYSFDASTVIFKDQRVRVWIKIYKSDDADETPLDRIYEEVNCQTNRIRILTIRPRLEGDDEDSLPIIPFAGDAAIAERSTSGALRRAVCSLTRPETARSTGDRDVVGRNLHSGGSSRKPRMTPAPGDDDPAPGSAVLAPSETSRAQGSAAAPVP